MPRVSVIILAHRATFVPDAFKSVDAQTYRDREILVKYCDGAWWPEKMNEAVRGTSGELYAFLCDDDALHPTWLEKCVAALDRDRTDIAYTDNMGFGRATVRLALPDFTPDVLKTACVPHFTALVRRSLYDRVPGGYDGTQGNVDWDFWASCSELKATASHVRECLFGYRIEGQNESPKMNDRDAFLALHRKHPWIPLPPGREWAA